MIFTGDLSGNFLVLDARTGKQLYSFDTGGPIAGGVITYEVKGKQYVAGTLPVDVEIAPRQTADVVQSGAFKVSRPNGQPIRVESMTAYVSSVVARLPPL